MSSSPARGTTLKPMPGTYTAVEVSAPNEFRVVERRVAEPGPGQVRIRVEACGVCHSDSATVEGLFPIDWRPGLGGWPARGCRLPRRLLRLLRVLSKWGSRELS